MDNLKAIEAWRAWMEANESFPGDVSVADKPNVDFWFAKNGEDANVFFHCFAQGGDGSLLAVYSAKGGKFASGPVVHLGHEGQVFVVADDVPNAIALFAASGDSYEQAIYGDDDLELDKGLAAWLKKTFDVKVPKSVAAAVKAAGKAHAKAGVEKHVATLNGG
jgi:hypothetical protein